MHDFRYYRCFLFQGHKKGKIGKKRLSKKGDHELRFLKKVTWIEMNITNRDLI